MANPYGATHHMALLALAALLMLTSMVHAASTNTNVGRDVFVNRQYHGVGSPAFSYTILPEPPLPHHTHKTVQAITPRGIFFTNTLASASPITVPLAPPMPRQNDQTIHLRALQDPGSSATTVAVEGPTAPKVAFANATEATLMSTQTLDPTTITITLEGISLSSAQRNDTSIPLVNSSSSQLSTITSLQVPPGCTAACGRDDESGECSEDNHCVGDGNKTLQSTHDSGCGKNGVEVVVLVAMLTAFLYL